MNIKNIKQFDENSAYLAELTNKLDKLESAYDEKEAKNRQNFEEGIKIDKENRAMLEKALLEYVDNNPEELFTESKTYKNAFLSVSKRSSTSLEFAEGFNAKKVMQNIKDKFKAFSDRFIVAKESIDKTAIKASIKSKELDEKTLKKMGFVNEEKETISLKIN